MAESGTCPSYTRSQHLRPDERYHSPPAEILIAQELVPILKVIDVICYQLSLRVLPDGLSLKDVPLKDKINDLTIMIERLSERACG